MKTNSKSATINISKPNAYRKSKSWCNGPLLILCTLVVQASLSGQNVQPYPNAITDRLVHTKTPMAPPMVNIPFVDPDFGSQMVRVTDETSQFLHPGGYFA